VAAPVYFKLTFQPGLKHAATWIGSLDNTKTFASTVKMMFWQDAQGLGWGICQPAVWFAYQQAMSSLALSEHQTVMQTTEFEVVLAIDPRNWSF